MIWPLLIICIFLPTSVPEHDLRAVYPGPVATIEGWNYSSSPPAYSALHFTTYPPGTWFRQSNSADGCHWDGFEWGSVLRYYSTHHECDGVEEDTLYNPPITVMPATWDGQRWLRSDTSMVTTFVDNEPVCGGLNEWTAEVHGLEQITPGEWAVHVSSTQTTTWDRGPCAPWVTEWREDYYFTDRMRRSVGGNLDGSFRWDVWFDR